MRKEYDFSGGVRGRYSRRGRIRHAERRSTAGKLGRKDFDDGPLTQTQVRELRRRAADLDNPVRYLLVSRFGRRFALYYNVSDDVYAMNEPRSATLFKRKKAALAVKQLLGPRVRALRCTTKRENGVRVPILGKRSRSIKPPPSGERA